MGCTVSKNDVKNRKVKIRFIPYKPREVRTELDLNPHSNESRLSQLKPISKSDPLDTPLVLKPQRFYRSHSDFSRTTKNQRRGDRGDQRDKTTSEAEMPNMDDFPQQVDGTEYQQYRPVPVPDLRGITKTALPDFEPTNKESTCVRVDINKVRMNLSTLIKSQSSIRGTNLYLTKKGESFRSRVKNDPLNIAAAKKKESNNQVQNSLSQSKVSIVEPGVRKSERSQGKQSQGQGKNEKDTVVYSTSRQNQTPNKSAISLPLHNQNNSYALSTSALPNIGHPQTESTLPIKQQNQIYLNSFEQPNNEFKNPSKPLSPPIQYQLVKVKNNNVKVEPSSSGIKNSSMVEQKV